MHYVAYLDEFGHIGPFVSDSHPKFNDSPVFGFGGLLLPVDQIREFAVYFYKLKCRLLEFEITNREDKTTPPYQWEKKGSSLYTLKNFTKYEELRRATNRLLNHIKKIGGYVFYTGAIKAHPPEEHESPVLFRQELLQAVKKIDRFCLSKESTVMIVLDHQDAGGLWREQSVEACTLTMFEGSDKAKTLIEPPIQAESHLFQTIQCADWICGMIGRLAAYEARPDEYPDWEYFKKHLSARIADVAIPGCALCEAPHSGEAVHAD